MFYDHFGRRTLSRVMHQQALDSRRSIAEPVAVAHGATVEGAVPSVSNSTLGNDDTLAATVRAGLVRVNGASQVHEAKQWTASEHRALFAEALPSVYFFVGCTPKAQEAATAPANHSPKLCLD